MSSSGKLLRVAKSGGAVTELAAGLIHPYSIVVDDRAVYVADRFDGAIWRVPKQGGAAKLLAAGEAEPEDLFQIDDRLFWAYEGSCPAGLPPCVYDGTIRSVDKAGGPVTELVSGQRWMGGVTGDVRGLWWGSHGTRHDPQVDGAIYFLATGEVEPQLISTGISPIRLAGDDEFLYQLDPDGNLFRIAKE